MSPGAPVWDISGSNGILTAIPKTHSSFILVGYKIQSKLLKFIFLVIDSYKELKSSAQVSTPPHFNTFLSGNMLVFMIKHSFNQQPLRPTVANWFALAISPQQPENAGKFSCFLHDIDVM